ncbi:cobW/P47K family domain-containing protein, putative, partial [Eimeria tenella]
MVTFNLGGSFGEKPKLLSLQQLERTIGQLLWGDAAADTPQQQQQQQQQQEEEAAAAAAEEPSIFRCKGLFPAWRDTPDDDETDT